MRFATRYSTRWPDPPYHCGGRTRGLSFAVRCRRERLGRSSNSRSSDRQRSPHRAPRLCFPAWARSGTTVGRRMSRREPAWSSPGRAAGKGNQPQLSAAEDTRPSWIVVGEGAALGLVRAAWIAIMRNECRQPRELWFSSLGPRGARGARGAAIWAPRESAPVACAPPAVLPARQLVADLHRVRAHAPRHARRARTTRRNSKPRSR